MSYADPHVPSVLLDGTVLKAVGATDGNVADADCVVILTDHPEFDYARIVDVAKLVVDARNATWGLATPPGRVVRL